jgi:hypothetical protein
MGNRQVQDIPSANFLQKNLHFFFTKNENKIEQQSLGLTIQNSFGVVEGVWEGRGKGFDHWGGGV